MITHQDNRWDGRAEVVIIGYGLAGAVAAIAAHDRGARVLILEKQRADSHCSCSSIAMGIFLSPTDVAQATEYLTALCQVCQPETPWTDLDTIRAWAKYAVQNKDWLTRLGGNIKFFSRGGEFAQFPEHPGFQRRDIMQRRF